MRKLILAPLAFALLIGAASAQQAPTFNVGNLPADPSTGTLQTAGNTSAAAIAAATGTTGDAAYAGSGAGTVVALNKGQYAILSNIYAAGGTTADTAATATGAAGTQVALLKALRDKLNGTLTVSGTVAVSNAFALDATITARLGTLGQKAAAASTPVVIASDQSSVAMKIDQTTAGTTNGVVVNSSALPSGAATSANQTTMVTSLGGTGDTAYAGSGTASVIAALKGVYTALLAPTPTGSNVIGSTTLRTTGTNRSATVGTTAITLMAANANRQGWKIKNDTAGDIWINFDGTATATPGSGNIKIPAGTFMSSEPGFVETGAISAIGSAAGLAITAREH